MDNVEQHTEGLAGAQCLCFIHPGLMEMLNGDVGSLVWESQARYRAWTCTLGHSFTGPSHTAQKKRGIYHLTERLSGGKQWFEKLALLPKTRALEWVTFAQRPCRVVRRDVI